MEGMKAVLINTLVNQFKFRVAAKKGVDKKKVGLSVEENGNHLFVAFTNPSNETSFLDIPMPFVENGVQFIERNSVRRPLCDFFIRKAEKRLNYFTLLQQIIFGSEEEHVKVFTSKGIGGLQQIVNSFMYGNTFIAVANLQRTINEVLNQMPVHNTYMNSWAMNNRLVILDPDFEDIRDPDLRLEYQLDKADQYFDRGWTAMGLSDGVLSDNNYILTTDLRKTVPFGLAYHNPQRNLYSTLGMKGAESALIRSRTASELSKKGIERGGWNLFTAFADVPEVWEDQILLDKSLQNLKVTYERRVVGFGTPLVKEGEVVTKGTKLYRAPDGQAGVVSFAADKIWVKSINQKQVVVGESEETSVIFVLKFERTLKEGTKITNTAANKGVIRFKDLGYAECNGRKEKIQVLVSSKAILKRKNYTQVFEALMNNITGNEPVVVEDGYCPSMEEVEKALVRVGLNEDGSWSCNTYAGKFRAVCGTVFWGVTMDVEDMLWTRYDTTRVNGRNLRTAGLKFSTVEIRALETRFGKDNPVIDEIMSYSQGAKDISEMIKILKSKLGEKVSDTEIPLENIAPLDNVGASILKKEALSGTVSDERIGYNGFMMRIPTPYQVVVRPDNTVTYEGFPAADVAEEESSGNKVISVNAVYVPYYNLRNPWRHETGKYGLNSISTAINSMVATGHRFLRDKSNGNLRAAFYRSIHAYFDAIAHGMGSKTGEISQYTMAVRYPFSAKAVATLSCELQKNTVQIHKGMAETLDVKSGDIVLVERFPCLGFMSLRPQRVVVTDDPMCKYTIRVSGNSLGSLSLDFDGDVIYLASFHTEAARAALKREFENPNKTCYSAIQKLNEKMGHPHYKEMSLPDYEIQPFVPLTKETHRGIVDKATGVKAHTGPVIALCYNIMRLIENSDVKNNQKVNVAVELFLDKVGNSVFKQKHGIKSLHQIVTKAICTADLETLVAEGFKRGTSEMICNLISKKAREIGVKDLRRYYKFTEKGGGNIISRLVREQNSIYFASRALLEGCRLLYFLEREAVDVPSRMFKWSLTNALEGKDTPLSRKLLEVSLNREIKDSCLRAKVSDLMGLMDHWLVAGNQSGAMRNRMMAMNISAQKKNLRLQ